MNEALPARSGEPAVAGPRSVSNGDPTTARTYVLLDARRRPYESPVKGLFGGHLLDRVYGRLDCPAAARAIARGGYVRNRVFFADEQTAVEAGFRPCAACLPQQYQRWRST